MDAERWQKIKSIFESAQELAPPEREIFLEKTCAADAELRREVEILLESFDQSDDFMENPAAAEAVSMFEGETNANSNPDEGKFISGTILASRYRIIGILGKGGMGEVYRAEDIKLSQTVALKFLPEKLEKDKAALNRFIGEVRIARQVAHGNVCRVFDLGEARGKHFISMEYVDGDDLASLLRRIGRVPSERAVEIARQLCSGLHAIHDAGILHRDFKPTNIIIDSKGKVRITDFGIAGFEAEISNDEMRVGTPAYMSPEQITGKEISVRSDIYALGLVLYEIFTGKQAFQADSVLDLIRKQQTETPTNPSEFVKGIDPLVEKVIFQCLEKNPANRPPSALSVAMALPGGNPLQVALEAGETPSPEMVAAAPKKGALKPVVALALLVAAILSIGLFALASKRIALHRLVPLDKSPEVLRERSRELTEKFGYPANDSHYGFFRHMNYPAYLEKNDSSLTRWQKLASGQPAVYKFWYRQSPEPIAPLSSGAITVDDPPNNVSGMAQMYLDTRGRLLFFDAVPPRIATNDSAAAAANFDWTQLFKEAGLNINDFKETASLWSPPRPFDTRRAWAGVYPEQREIAIRVEAALYQGRLVQFEIVEPWSTPQGQTVYQGGVSTGVDGLILLTVVFSVMFFGAWFAIRNVRGSRSDLRGAFRVTVFLFFLQMLNWIFEIHHIATASEIRLFLKGLQSALFWASFAGLLYLAFEPYLRKHAPERVISWNRLIAGDWRDPLVGRDILIGGVIGVSFMALSSLRYLIPIWLGEPTPIPYGISNPGGSALLGLRGFPVLFLNQTGASLVFGFIISFLVLFFSLLLRNKTFGSAAVWLLIFIFGISGEIAGGKLSGGVIYAVLFPTALVLAASRFGVLAAVSVFFFHHIVVFYPVTTEFSAWYAGDFLICAGILIALAVYGFYTSLAGEKIFQGKLLRDIE